MRKWILKLGIFLFLGIHFIVPVSAQEKSSFSPILSIRFGQNQTVSASSFLDVYNNPYIFLRPFFLSAQRWPLFKPFKNEKTWAAELSFEIKNRFSVGISLEYQNLTAIEKQTYSGIVGYDESDNPIFFNIDEKHIFRTKFMPIIAFIDYPIFKKSLIYPVIGFGVGVSDTELRWNWDLHSAQLYERNFYTIDYDRTWFKMKEKKFIYQPRFRLVLNFMEISKNIGKYIDNLHLQVDYIYCKGNYDLFKRFRDEFLPGERKENVADNIKKVFEDYEVKWGGLQFMFGISIKQF